MCCDPAPQAEAEDTVTPPPQKPTPAAKPTPPPPPTLTRISAPARPDDPAQALPGDHLVATGTGFGPAGDADAAVLVSTGSGPAVSAQIITWADGQIRFAFPDGTGAAGPKQVRVRTRNGISATATVLLEDRLRLSAAPVALLPLGVQTRFMADGRELWVRALPDTVHVHSHDERLTQEEAELGRRYRDAADREEVWLDLTTRFGVPRAEWIVHATLSGAVAIRDNPWARAARSRLLPRRLYATAYDDAGNVIAQQHGQPIPFELPIGPDLAATGTDPSQDPGMSWLVDFAEAQARGMALKMRLPDPPPQRIARLVVVGAETSLTPEQGAHELANALAAHRYTRGIGFLNEGAPTNLTPDTGTGSGPAGAVRPPDTPATTAADGNAAATAWALGLAAPDAAVFSATPAADDGAALRRARREMNTALWPATWGYFLAHMFAPVVPPEAVEPVREHFTDWVRGAGPQPVLRVGEQPYGLLPVLPLDRWAPRDEEPPVAALAAFLRDSLRPIWRDSVASVPRIGDQSPGAASDENPLLTVLSLQPTSVSFRGRSVLDMSFVDAAWRFIGNRLSAEWRTEQAALARAVLDAHGLAGAQPNLARTVFAANYFPVPFALVQSGGDRSQPPAADWLTLLRDAGWQDLRQDAFPLDERPLLYLLLRHSLLVAYLFAAGRMEPSDPWQGGEPALYGIDEIDDNLTAPRPRMAWERLTATSATGVAKGELLDANPQPPLAAVKTAIDGLIGAPVHVLEQAAAETLDLSAYRLDAWITSFAQRRLHAIRGAQGTGGVHLGAYGMVEDIRRGDGGSSAGYVHTPSPAHATAAAILASGYRSHPGGAGTRHPFGIDLSSDRVRLALGLLDGVRAGQQLGALLGYRFERMLQERGLGRFIDDFRTLAPLPVTGTAPPGAAAEAVATRNVADGLDLHRRWVAAERSTAPNWPTSAALQPVFEQLDDAVDAVGDILLTEGVFQLGRGNADRAAAALRAAAHPDGALPELEAVYTPHSGTAVTHRLVVLLPGDLTAAPGWTPDPAYARRAAADPRLDAWAGRLLGDPKRVHYRVRYLDPVSGTALAEEERTLDQLTPALSPLDVVYAAVATEQHQLSELERRIVYHAARTRPAGVPADARIQVTASRQPELPYKIGLLELMELAQAMRETLAGGRPVTPDDLSLPETPGIATVDLADLWARADAATAALHAAGGALAAAMVAPAGEPLRAALLAANALGVSGAVPVSASGDTPAARTDLLAQAAVAAAEVRRRISQLDALSAPAPGDTAGRVADALTRLRTVLGTDFQALPRYTAPPVGNGTQVDVGFPATESLLAGDPFGVTRWFQQLARVRDGAQRLNDLMLYADVLGGVDPLAFKVAQLPATPGDRWVGLPFGTTPPAGRVSLVALLPAGQLRAAGTMTGLMIEQYSEVLPARAKTTGLALHYDQPNAAPPQAILLAVPPRPGEEWTLQTLRATVDDTLDLAKLRMVDLDSLQESGQFLPATYLAYNGRGVTVATDFLTGRGAPLA
ncbi:hypothetical protein V6U81_25465 [Micromonospora sp. CPCC 205711]|uniref:hypothetical protein n=1 Tax=Micromonospora sp. CPCC 205547 TaxID=3122400 RepID=UPI002FEFD842